MPRDPIPAWFFVVVIVRKENKYLLVQETHLGNPWYLPAGRVEFGERFPIAALRETLEESGIPVELTGVIRVEHTTDEYGMRIRVIYVAEPASDVEPKSTADEHSLRAAWVSREELTQYSLRGQDVVHIIDYLESGGTVFPLTVLDLEHSPFKDTQ